MARSEGSLLRNYWLAFDMVEHVRFGITAIDFVGLVGLVDPVDLVHMGCYMMGCVDMISDDLSVSKSLSRSY
jgi:hypothetical protein